MLTALLAERVLEHCKTGTRLFFFFFPLSSPFSKTAFKEGCESSVLAPAMLAGVLVGRVEGSRLQLCGRGPLGVARRLQVLRAIILQQTYPLGLILRQALGQLRPCKQPGRPAPQPQGPLPSSSWGQQHQRWMESRARCSVDGRLLLGKATPFSVQEQLLWHSHNTNPAICKEKPRYFRFLVFFLHLNSGKNHFCLGCGGAEVCDGPEENGNPGLNEYGKPNLHGVSLPVSRQVLKLRCKAVKKPCSFVVMCFGDVALAFEACKLLLL